MAEGFDKEKFQESLNQPKTEAQILEELAGKKFRWHPVAALGAQFGIPFLKTFKGKIVLVLLASAFLTILLFELYLKDL